MAGIAPPASLDGAYTPKLIEEIAKFCLLVLAYVHLWVRVSLFNLLASTDLADNVEFPQMVFYSDAVNKVRERAQTLMEQEFGSNAEPVTLYRELSDFGLIKTPAKGDRGRAELRTISVG